MTQLVCNTCKKPITGQAGTARFPCPKCLKYEIVRCVHCREIAAHYVCPQCKFEGPN
ncbi:MAG TPA: zinc finger domain-containing protein [Candidatus Nanoarchaeia archaeon]|nr:zinc finger domain-containing protein [Candidatus Nanoarchaeia archaeon]